ncbi:MAG: hypothetical protein GC136_00595 [Alphaproteobacteria bacterium]|nr:hypothetical protein [Alphaproteobacteria bacterium]
MASKYKDAHYELTPRALNNWGMALWYEANKADGVEPDVTQSPFYGGELITEPTGLRAVQEGGLVCAIWGLGFVLAFPNDKGLRATFMDILIRDWRHEVQGNYIVPRINAVAELINKVGEVRASELLDNPPQAVYLKTISAWGTRGDLRKTLELYSGRTKGTADILVAALKRGEDSTSLDVRPTAPAVA